MTATMSLLAAEGPNGPFFPGDIYEFWWGLLAFLIVFGLLAWKVLPLAKEALNKGQADAIAEGTAAAQAQADAQAKVAALRAELGDADTAAAQIVADAQTNAQQLRLDSANRTQQLVNDMWAKAQSDAASMKVQAQTDVQAEVASQAVGAAEEIVRTSLNPARHGDLIDDYIAKLGTSS